MQPTEKVELVRECCVEVEDTLRRRRAAGGDPIAASLADLSPVLTPIISGALDLIVSLIGPTVDRLVVARRDDVRQLLSDHVIEFLDGLVEDLKAPPPVTGGAPGAEDERAYGTALQADGTTRILVRGWTKATEEAWRVPPIAGGAPGVPQPKGRTPAEVPQPKGRSRSSGPATTPQPPPRSSGPVGIVEKPHPHPHPHPQPKPHPQPRPRPAPPVPPEPEPQPEP